MALKRRYQLMRDCLVLLACVLAAEVFAADAALYRISWEPPTSDEAGVILPESEINGYDIFVSMNGALNEYLAWVENKDGGVRHYDHLLTDRGRYCYQLRTVTDAGKSKLSTPVCMDFDGDEATVPVYTFPNPPEDITVGALEFP